MIFVLPRINFHKFVNIVLLITEVIIYLMHASHDIKFCHFVQFIYDLLLINNFIGYTFLYGQGNCKINLNFIAFEKNIGFEPFISL